MLKLVIPIMMSAQNFRLASISTFWFLLSVVSLYCSGLTQLIFFCSGSVQPFVCLSIWVGAMMLLASSPQLGSGSLWLVVSVSSLTVFLIFAFTSSSLISFYYFFESTLLPTLFLIYGWGNQPERLQAATYLLVYTVLGSLPLLLAISVFAEAGWGVTYGVFMSLTPLGSGFASSSVLWFCLMGAFFIKLPMYPVHLWLPKAHVEAPLAGSMALAGTLLKLGVLGVMTVGQLVWFPSSITSFILGLSLWGSLVTSIICVRQTDMKALIAYSSIGHMGLALGGLLSGSDLGVKGAIVVAVAHGLSSPAMFSLAGVVYDVSYSRSLFLCKGLGAVFPGILFPLFLLCAANMSAPPLVNLVGEIWLIISVSAFAGVTSLVIGLMCLLVGAYSLYLYTSVSHGSAGAVSNPGHLYSVSNYFILFMQSWPMLALMFNLPILLF